MAKRFDGKVAVVTGGANGIGRASAIRFAQDGARVAVLDIEDGPLADTVAAIRDVGGEVVAIACDLMNREQVEGAFAKIVQDLGPVDILLNNVGQTARERASEFWCSDPAIWDFVVGVSLMTTLSCSRQVVPSMRERKTGKIVNIASDSAIAGDHGIADYAAAKAGVMGFTRSLAQELAEFGVNVNSICPGGTNTRGPRRLPKETFDRALAAIPMGHMCEPEDIANGVAFLASDEARFITGQTLVINGGRVFY
ncbi:SDR family NAD(P)-dependent oxidoreductase [Microvirga antarctica]|uniref:SDR family NAD(P)-dependent oxidoreductase n=1 Tax=Microvirga antarctica TaxID=2819233 RepID=UPI001B306E88|nr:SDR family NAD(P)-dependent oxidoreductase [Microvirga antarctica]